MATVYVASFPFGNVPPYELPVSGAHHPLWSQDGSELYVFPGGAALTAVKVRTTPSFEALGSSVVPGAFTANTSPTSSRNHDILPGGGFVTVDDGGIANGTSTPTTIEVVLNWFDELNRLVPPK